MKPSKINNYKKGHLCKDKFVFFLYKIVFNQNFQLPNFRYLFELIHKGGLMRLREWELFNEHF